MNPHRLKAYFYLLLTSIIWGIAGPVIKFTLGGISPLNFLTYRFGISSLLALGTFTTKKEHLPKSTKKLITLLVYGFLTSTVTLGLLFFGLAKTSVLDASLISTANPLLTVLAGVIVFKDHITKKEKLGMAIAFSGTLLTATGPLLTGDGIRLSGNVLILLYLLVNTISSIMIKKLMREEIDPLLITNISFIIGFITFVPFVIFGQGLGSFINSLLYLSFPYHLGVLFMAILSGSLAYTLWAKGQKTIEVSEAALFNYLYPIFSAPLAVFWLKEKITFPFVVGAIIITIGVVIAEYKKRKYNRSL